MRRRVVRRVLGWVDVVVPVMLGLFMLALVLGLTAPGWVRLAGYAAVVVSAAALYWRRRRPVAMMAVLLVAGAVFQLVAPEALFPYASLIGLWALTTRRPVTWSAPALAGVLGLILLVVPSKTTPREDVEFAVLLAVAIWAMAWALRSQRLVIEQAAARMAVEEQSRLARDIHDVIAHSVSVIVVQAAAADDVFETHPERARQSLRSIESTGRDALAELRRLLAAAPGDGGGPPGQGTPAPGLERGPRSAGGPRTASPPSSPLSSPRPWFSDNRLRAGLAGFRAAAVRAAGRWAPARRTGSGRPTGPEFVYQTTDSASLAPQPTLDRIGPDILTPLEAAGLRTEFTVHGDAASISLGLQLAAFRIVQESLTNVLRHGQGADARVVVTVGEEVLGIVVENLTGSGDALPRAGIPGVGRGIAGMRERAALVGGVVEAGPVPVPGLPGLPGPDGSLGRGFRVCARLPVRSAVRL